MSKLIVFTATILATMFSSALMAQNLANAPLVDAQDSTEAQNDSVNVPFNHRAGLALSLAISEISFGTPALMVTSFYQYRLSPLLALELSAVMLQGVNSKRYLGASLISENIDMNSVAHSIAGNIAAVFSPFAEKRLQLGLGVSVRWAGLLGSSITTRLDSLSQTSRVTDTQQFALGANAHCEYIFPLGGNVDLGVRAHSQLFFPPFAVVGQREPIGYITRQMTSVTSSISFPSAFYGLNGGLGAFLRIGF